MQRLDYYKMFVNPRDFDEGIGIILHMLCEKSGEAIEENVKIISEAHNLIIADFFLSDGCKFLGIESNTYVELSWRITDNSFRNAALIHDYKHANVAIITSEDISFIEYKIYGFIGRNIKLISLESLIADYGKFNETLSNTDANSSTPSDNKFTLTNPIEDNEDTLNELKDIVNYDKNITLVLGAGVSKSVGLPTWEDLLKHVLRVEKQAPLTENEYDHLKGLSKDSLLITARYLLKPFVMDKESKTNLTEILTEILYKDYKGESSDLIDAIVDLCRKRDGKGNRLVTSIITTNYDDIVESMLASKEEDVDQVVSTGRRKGSGIPVIHVHGILRKDKHNVEIPVLSEEEYHQLYMTNHHWSNVEMLFAFYRSTCIFIGLSMTDPNIRRLLEYVATQNLISDAKGYHYAILPFESIELPEVFTDSEAIKNYECKKRQEDVFKKLGVKIIWYKKGEFTHVPKILKYIGTEREI